MLTSLLSGIPALLSGIVNGVLTFIGLRNAPAIVKNVTTQVVTNDNTVNTDVVKKAVDDGDVTDIQNRGGVK
jgi:hypothetical protein